MVEFSARERIIEILGIMMIQVESGKRRLIEYLTVITTQNIKR
jgi:hypothetical protein